MKNYIHSHTHRWLIALIQLLGIYTPNFNLSGPLITFWQSKQLPTDMAMVTTAQVLITVSRLLTDDVPNLNLIGHLISSWQL